VARVLIRIGIALAVILVGLGLYLNFADLSSYRSDVEKAVSAATGRDFRIAGEFKPQVFPAPALIAEDITLANAEWAGDTPFVSVGHLSVTVDLWSLIAGPARIRTFHLRDVDILLQENEAGDVNWLMTAKQRQSVAIEATHDETIPAIINFAELRDIKITRQRPGFEDRVAILASLDLKTNDDNFIVAQGQGEIDEHELNLSATLGPVDHLASGGDLEYWLSAELGVADINITGRTGDPSVAIAPHLEALLTSADVTALLKMFELSAELSGPLRVESTLAEEGGEPVLRVQANVSDINAEVSARKNQSRIDFDATISSLRQVGDALQVAGLPDAALVLAGGVSNNRDSFELHDVSAGIQAVELHISGVIGKSQSVANKIDLSIAAPSLQDLHSELPAIPLAATVTAALSVETPGHQCFFRQ